MWYLHYIVLNVVLPIWKQISTGSGASYEAMQTQHALAVRAYLLCTIRRLLARFACVQRHAHTRTNLARTRMYKCGMYWMRAAWDALQLAAD